MTPREMAFNLGRTADKHETSMRWVLRIQPAGTGPSREEVYPTKRALFAAVGRLGQLSFIRKVAPHTYSVRAKGKK